MSTIDTSTWNPDADLNVEIEGIPLNSDAGIQQTWQALRVLMAAVKGDGDAIKTMIDVMTGATAFTDGASGLVPKPEAGDQDKVLKGDGTWGTVAAASHTHGNVTNDGKLSTASRAVVTDENGVIGASSVTATELGCLSGVTSNVQTQLNGKIEEPDLWNWQKTVKAGAVACYPVPESDLEPVVEFAFAETAPAEGEKTPSNPSAIAGVSSVTVTRCETEGVGSTDYVVSLGGTRYGGSINLSTGVMTVTWAGFILDGTENTLYYFGPSAGAKGRMAYSLTEAGLPLPSGNATDSVCSHSSVFNASNDGVWGEYYVRNNGYFLMHDKNNVIGSNVSSYKSWLAGQYAAGTPVTVAYLVATPVNIQLTPTQVKALPSLDKYVPRINTIYSDQQSVQVGYQRFFNESAIALLEARIEALEEVVNA